MKHVLLVAALASAPGDVDAIDATKSAAYAEGEYAFCTDPPRPLGPRQRSLCSAAKDVPECQGLRAACDLDSPAPPPDWLARLARWAAPFATGFLYLLVIAIAIIIAIPVISALRQLRLRRRRATDLARPLPNVGTLLTPARDERPLDETDPDEALRLAEESLARGDHRASLALSLAAALGALGRRGAIKLARHRTNGEYVRGCAEDTARPPLREIVRAVDAMEFGGAPPTDDAARRVTARAREIVRAAAVVATLGLALLGCTPPKKGADPAGDELPIAVLARNGFTIKPLGSSLSTMPIPTRDEGAPVVIIDVERVPLDDETEAHLMRWVEAGGVLVLFGNPSGWPSELRPRSVSATTRDLFVTVAEPGFSGARVARHNAFAWKDGTTAVPLALLGTSVYASKRRVGDGLVLGVANDDLFTNIGVMPKRNAAALVTLLRSVHSNDVRVARPEDGIPPPSNPFAALIASGLGKGAWHALAAALLLFLAYGIRHARPRSAPDTPRRSFREHVEATGAFYARARARSHGLASYGRFLEVRLREAAPRGTDPATFLAARSGATPERAAELYARALAAKPDDVPKGDELDVIAELRAMAERALIRR